MAIRFRSGCDRRGDSGCVLLRDVPSDYQEGSSGVKKPNQALEPTRPAVRFRGFLSRVNPTGCSGRVAHLERSAERRIRSDALSLSPLLRVGLRSSRSRVVFRHPPTIDKGHSLGGGSSACRSWRSHPVEVDDRKRIDERAEPDATA